MKNEDIAIFSLQHTPLMMNEFEEALQNSMRRYSLRQMNFMDNIWRVT
jgi:hypothetical protein